jgi:hypothetical protein
MSRVPFSPPVPGEIASRERLTGNLAASGAILDRLTLTDGTRLVAKTISPELDWIMGETHDEGRAATLFTDGVLDRLPASIDHAVLGAERDGDRWTIYMRDLGDALYASDRRLTREESTRVLEAMTQMHRVFLDEDLPGLCDLVDAITLFAPARGRRLIAEGRDLEMPDLVLRGKTWTLWTFILRGWELVPEVFPPDLADALLRFMDEPGVLADALSRRPCTLNHGDLKTNNLGFAGGRTLLIDWGSLTARAPGASDFVLFASGGAFEASPDELEDDYRRIAGDLFDEVAVDLSHLQTFAFFGCQFAFSCVEDEDEMRAISQEETVRWIPRLRLALERTGIV